MKKFLAVVSLAVALPAPSHAQTYKQMQWGIDSATNPHAFGPNWNGALSPLGNLSDDGVIGLRQRVRGVFADVATFTASKIGSSVTSIRVDGYYAQGDGGAAASKRIYAQAAVPTLAAGASATFYFYHTFLSSLFVKPITVLPVASFGNPSYEAAGLSVTAIDNATVTNREGSVTFKNNTGASITGATYLLWIQVED